MVKRIIKKDLSLLVFIFIIYIIASLISFKMGYDIAKEEDSFKIERLKNVADN